MAETAQTSVPMNNLDLFADDDIPKYREKREHRGHGRLAVYDKERDMVDFEAIGEVSNSSTSFIRMSDNDDFMSTIDEFLKRDKY